MPVTLVPENNQVTILISNQKWWRARVFFCIQAGYLSLQLIVMQLPAIAGEGSGGLMVALMLLLLQALIIARYIQTATFREEITVQPRYINLMQKSFLQKRVRQFDVKKIAGLRLSFHQPFTSHPLDGHTTDYLGFGMREKEMQHLIAVDSIEFFYDGKYIRFGRGLSELDALYIMKQIKHYAERSLQYTDEMEKIVSG